jgi:phosphate:Na+ symporter
MAVSDWAWVATLAGGLGLFLLGMAMMTDGLRMAAGAALERILRAATRTRWHALGTGMLVTALVQSSSAVTVAIIGFANAGLLGLGGALWVLFGANVGTTMTGWIVALLGLQFKVEALALPLIGAGALLRLGTSSGRRSALGSTLAGFGLLFLGIALMQQAFSGAAANLAVPAGTGALRQLAQVGTGALMTILMQSSSAALVVTLTAAQQGVIDLPGAAALVIGANVGTTVKAILAALNATPNARRVAAGHVIFNAVTAVVALVLLPWIAAANRWVLLGLDIEASTATQLALFHTSFNVLGVALMWPIGGALARWLESRFAGATPAALRPAYLDQNVLAVPALAVGALRQEIQRVADAATRAVAAVAAGQAGDVVRGELDSVQALSAACDAFVERMNRGAMDAPTSALLAGCLRTLAHFERAAELARSLADGTPVSRRAAPLEAITFGNVIAQLLRDVRGEPEAPGEALAESLRAFDEAYESAKSALLVAGAEGGLDLRSLDLGLRQHSALRAAVEQACKGWRSGQTAPADKATRGATPA